MKIKALIFIGLFLTNLTYAQTDTIVDYIKKETIEGKLDFKKELIKQGKDKSLIVYDGLAYNPNQFSILLWGQAVKRLGIKSGKEAREIWEQIYNKEMTDPEKKALMKGYKMKIKKE